MTPLLIVALVAVIAQVRTPHWATAVGGVTAALLHGIVSGGPTPWVYASLMGLVNVGVFVVEARRRRGPGPAGSGLGVPADRPA